LLPCCPARRAGRRALPPRARACDSRRDSSSARPASNASALLRPRAEDGKGDAKKSALDAELKTARKGVSGSDATDVKEVRLPYMAQRGSRHGRAPRGRGFRT
jgi:hypothetical protein